MAMDMGQPLIHAQHSHMSSLGSVPSVPGLASGQASLAGSGMGYLPMSSAQTSIVQPHQVMNHMLNNYMQMVQWSQVCSIHTLLHVWV